MVKANEKGNAFEWLVAKTLSRWLQPASTTELIRSTQSGGWSERSLPQVGDLAPGGPAGFRFRQAFSVECKHWKNIDFWWYFTAPKNEFLLYWLKTVDEAFKYGVIPLYIVRQNARPIVVCFQAVLAAPPGSSPIYLYEWDMQVITLDRFLAVTPEWYYENWTPASGRGQ